MNLVDIVREFPNEVACRRFLERMRWPDGVRCLRCQSKKVKRLTAKDKAGPYREIFYCSSCRHQFTVTVGTIFHDSHLPLTKWLIAIGLMCEAKKGISALQMKRNLGVSYKTAWYLCHRIRKAMASGNVFGKLGGGGGIVESDETYIGGKYDRRRKRRPYEKQAVMGIVERGGMVKVEAIPTASRKILLGKLKEHVADDVRLVVTDELAAYKHTPFPHAAVNHGRYEWVRGKMHTNTVENFWSLLKRGIVGSFHRVSVKHLPRYLGEFQYRFNRRHEPELFGSTVKHLLTTDNLPYSKLTAEEVVV